MDYTNKTSVPQYLPTGKRRDKDMIKLDKYNQLLLNIEKSSLSEKEKDFLRIAATRHIEFDYSAIAEYYCCASKEMQELMEESALVVIDFENAIKNGYVMLNKKIKEIIESRRNDE